MYMHTSRDFYTHHEEHAEVGQFSEEILHADRVRVKGKKAPYALVELLHVLVHRGQFLVLLPGMLAEAVRRTESRHKTCLKHTVISDIMAPRKYVHLWGKKQAIVRNDHFRSFIAFKKHTYVKVNKTKHWIKKGQRQSNVPLQ